MAAVTVFVDEAVQGDLPPVCARTGQPSDMVLRWEKRQGGVGMVALLLLLLGPLGWLALAVLVLMSGRRESLVVRLPYTERAFDEERQLRRSKVAAFAAGVASLALAVGLLDVAPGRLWLVPAVACFGFALICRIRETVAEVHVSLDASRRWVTLSNVHPDFVEAACASAGLHPRTRR